MVKFLTHLSSALFLEHAMASTCGGDMSEITDNGGLSGAFEFVMNCALTETSLANIAACSSYPSGSNFNAFLTSGTCRACYEDFFTAVMGDNTIIGAVCLNSNVFDPLLAGCAEILKSYRDGYVACAQNTDQVEILTGIPDARCSETNSDYLNSYFDPYYAMLMAGSEMSASLPATIQDWLTEISGFFIAPTFYPDGADFLATLTTASNTCSPENPCCECLQDFVYAIHLNALDVQSTCRQSGTVCADSSRSIFVSPNYYCPVSAGCLANSNVISALREFEYCSGWTLSLNVPVCSTLPLLLLSAVPAIRCIRGVGSLTGVDAGAEFNECMLRDPIFGTQYSDWDCKGCYIKLMNGLIPLSSLCQDDMYSLACLDATGLNDRLNANLVAFNECLGITNSFDRILFTNNRGGADYRCSSSSAFGGLANTIYLNKFDEWLVSSPTPRASRESVVATIGSSAENCAICFEDYVNSLVIMYLDTPAYITNCVGSPSESGCNDGVFDYVDIFQQCSGYPFRFTQGMCQAGTTLMIGLAASINTDPYFLGTLVKCAYDNSDAILCYPSVSIYSNVYGLLADATSPNMECGECFNEFVDGIRDRVNYSGEDFSVCFTDPTEATTFDYTIDGCLALIQFHVDRFAACHGSYDLISNLAPVEKCADVTAQTRYLPYSFIIDCVTENVLSTYADVMNCLDTNMFLDPYIFTFESDFASFTEVLASISCSECYNRFITSILVANAAIDTACSGTDKYLTSCYSTGPTGLEQAMIDFYYCAGQEMIVYQSVCADMTTSGYWDFTPIVVCGVTATLSEPPATNNAVDCLNAAGFGASGLGYLAVYSSTSCESLFYELIIDLRTFLADDSSEQSVCFSPFADSCWNLIEPIVYTSFYDQFRVVTDGARVEFTRNYDIARCVDTQPAFYNAGPIFLPDVIACASGIPEVSLADCVNSNFYSGVQVPLCGTICIPFLSLKIYNTFNDGSDDTFRDSQDCYTHGFGTSPPQTCALLWDMVESYQRCTGMAALPANYACTNVDGALDFLVSPSIFAALMDNFAQTVPDSTNYVAAVDLEAFIESTAFNEYSVNLNCQTCFTNLTSALTATATELTANCYDSQSLLANPFSATCWELLDPILDEFEACSGELNFFTGLRTTRCSVAQFEAIQTGKDIYTALTVCAAAFYGNLSVEPSDLLDCIDEVSGSKEIRDALYQNGVYTANIVVEGKGCPSCYMQYMMDIITAGSLPDMTSYCSGAMGVFNGVSYWPGCASVILSFTVSTALSNFQTCTGGSPLPTIGSPARTCQSYSYFTDVFVPWSQLIYCGEDASWSCLDNRNMVNEYLNAGNYYEDCEICFQIFFETYVVGDFLKDTVACAFDATSGTIGLPANCDGSLSLRGGPESDLAICLGFDLSNYAIDTTCVTTPIPTTYTYVMDLAQGAIDAVDEDGALAFYSPTFVSVNTDIDTVCWVCFKQFAMDIFRQFNQSELDPACALAVGALGCWTSLTASNGALSRFNACLGKDATGIAFSNSMVEVTQCTEDDFVSVWNLNHWSVAWVFMRDGVMNCALDANGYADTRDCMIGGFFPNLLTTQNCGMCFAHLSEHMWQVFNANIDAGGDCNTSAESSLCQSAVVEPGIRFFLCAGFVFNPACNPNPAGITFDTVVYSGLPISMRSAGPGIACLVALDSMLSYNAALIALDLCLSSDTVIGTDYTNWGCGGCYLNLFAKFIGTTTTSACQSNAFSNACLTSMGLGDNTNLNIVNFNLCLGTMAPANLVVFSAGEGTNCGGAFTPLFDPVQAFEFVMTCARSAIFGDPISSCIGLSTLTDFNTFITTGENCEPCYESFFTSAISNPAIKSTCVSDNLFDPLPTGCDALLDPLRTEFLACSGLELLSGLPADNRCTKPCVDYVDSYFHPYYGMLIAGREKTTESTIQDWLNSIGDDLLVSDPHPSSEYFTDLLTTGPNVCTEEYLCCDCFASFATAIANDVAGANTVSRDCYKASAVACNDSSVAIPVSSNIYCPLSTSCLANSVVITALRQFQYCSGWSLPLSLPDCSVEMPASLWSAVPAIRCVAGLSGPDFLAKFNECMLVDPIVGVDYSAWDCKECYLNFVSAALVDIPLPAVCAYDMYGHACLLATGMNDRYNLNLIEFNSCIGILNSFDRQLFNNDRSFADYRCPVSQFSVFANKMHVSYLFNCVTSSDNTYDTRACIAALLSSNAAPTDLVLGHPGTECSACFSDYAVALSVEYFNEVRFTPYLDVLNCMAHPVDAGCELTGTNGVVYTDIFEQCSGQPFRYASNQCDASAEACTQWTPAFLNAFENVLFPRLVYCSLVGGVISECIDLMSDDFFAHLETNFDGTDYLDSRCFSCFDDFVQNVYLYAHGADILSCFTAVPATVENFDWTSNADCITTLRPFIDRFATCQGGYDLVTARRQVPVCSATELSLFETRYQPFPYIVNGVLNLKNVSPNLNVNDFLNSLFAGGVDFLTCAQCYYGFTNDLYAYHQQGLLAPGCDPLNNACGSNPYVNTAVTKLEYCSGNNVVASFIAAPAACNSALLNSEFDSELIDYTDFAPIIYCAFEEFLADTSSILCLSAEFPDYFEAYSTGTQQCLGYFTALVSDIANALRDPDHPENLAACTYISSNECWETVAPQVAAFYHNLRLSGFEFVVQEVYDSMRCDEKYSVGGILYFQATPNSLAHFLLHCVLGFSGMNRVETFDCIALVFVDNPLPCRACVQYFVNSFFDIIALSIDLTDDNGTLYPEDTDSGGCYDQFKTEVPCPALWPMIQTYQQCSGMPGFGTTQACVAEDLALLNDGSFFANLLHYAIFSDPESLTAVEAKRTLYSNPPGASEFSSVYYCRICVADALTTLSTNSGGSTANLQSACYMVIDGVGELILPLPKQCWGYLDDVLNLFETCSGQFNIYTGIEGLVANSANSYSESNAVQTTRCSIDYIEAIMAYNDPFLALSVCGLSTQTDEYTLSELLDCIEEVSGNKDLRDALFSNGVYTSAIQANGIGCVACFFNFIVDVKSTPPSAECLEGSGCSYELGVEFRGDMFYPKCCTCYNRGSVAVALRNFYTCTGGSAMSIHGSPARTCSTFDFVTDIAQPWIPMINCATEFGYTHELEVFWDCMNSNNLVNDYLQGDTYSECQSCFSNFLSAYQADPLGYVVPTDRCPYGGAPCQTDLLVRNGPASDFVMCMGYDLDPTYFDCTINSGDISDFEAILHIGKLMNCAVQASNEDGALACYTATPTLGDNGCSFCYQAFAIDLMRATVNGGFGENEDYSVCTTNVDSAKCLALLNEDYAPLTRFESCLGFTIFDSLGAFQCTQVEYSTLRWLQTVDDEFTVPPKALECAFASSSAAEAITCLNLAYSVGGILPSAFNVPCISCVYRLMREIVVLFSTPELSGMKTHCAAFPQNGVCRYTVMWDVFNDFLTCAGFEFPVLPAHPRLYCKDSSFDPIGAIDSYLLFEAVTQCAIEGVDFTTTCASASATLTAYLAGAQTSECFDALQTYYTSVHTLLYEQSYKNLCYPNSNFYPYDLECLSLLNAPLEQFLLDTASESDSTHAELSLLGGETPTSCTMQQALDLDQLYAFAPAMLCAFANPEVQSDSDIRACIDGYLNAFDWASYGCSDCIVWFVTDIKVYQQFGAVTDYLSPFANPNCLSATTVEEVYANCQDEYPVDFAMDAFRWCSGGYAMYTGPPPSNPVCSDLDPYSDLQQALLFCSTDVAVTGCDISTPGACEAAQLLCIDEHDSIRLLPTYSSDCDLCLSQLLANFITWPFVSLPSIANAPWVEFSACMGSETPWFEFSFSPGALSQVCTATVNSILLQARSYTPWVLDIALGLNNGATLDLAVETVIAKAEHGLTVELVSGGDCTLCFNVFIKDLYFLNRNNPDSDFARACREPYSLDCIQLVLNNDPGPAMRFDFCTSGFLLTNGGPVFNACSSEQSAILQTDKIPFQMIALAVRTSSSYGDAVDAFDRILSADLIEPDMVPCKPCFYFLISSLFELSIPDRVACSQDFTSTVCLSNPIIADALFDFNNCAGFEFLWPTDPPELLSVTTSTTTQVPFGSSSRHGGGDHAISSNDETADSFSSSSKSAVTKEFAAAILLFFVF